jgi:hypothetical protein
VSSETDKPFLRRRGVIAVIVVAVVLLVVIPWLMSNTLTG